MQASTPKIILVNNNNKDVVISSHIRRSSKRRPAPKIILTQADDNAAADNTEVDDNTIGERGVSELACSRSKRSWQAAGPAVLPARNCVAPQRWPNSNFESL